MVRRIIAASAVVGALTLGTAGAAGAAGTTPSPAPSSSTTPPTTTPCSKLAQVLQRYHASELKVGKHLHKTAGLEARMRKLGHAKLAGIIGKKVRTAENREKRIEARLHQAVARCAAAGQSTSSTGDASVSGK